MDFNQNEEVNSLESIYYNLKENLYDGENYIDEIIKNKDFRGMDDASKSVFIERVGEIIANKESDIVSNTDKRSIEKDLIEKLEKDFKNRHIKKVPFFDIIKENDIVKKNQREEVWLDHSGINRLGEFVFQKLGQSDKNFFVTNVPLNSSRENIDGFVLTFLKPLAAFRSSVQRKNNFGVEKFSAVINLGEHWTSLTLVPSSNPDKAYVIYRDSFGKAMPDVLKKSLLSVYPEAKIEYSKGRIQKDSYSCGVFAVLATVGDKIISNSSIISSFMQRKQHVIADLDSKISQQAKNFSRENSRANSRKYSI